MVIGGIFLKKVEKNRKLCYNTAHKGRGVLKMKDKKNCIMILTGTILGIVLMGVVVCFTISRVKLVDKTYSAKVEIVLDRRSCSSSIIC